MTDDRGPSFLKIGDRGADKIAIWAGIVQAHAAIIRGLDSDLRAAHGLPLGDFRILLWLANEPCARMRMAALADTVQLSPSGLSRAIERLEARGLVQRRQCQDDRRGVDAILTETGTRLMADASATHAAAIERRFFAHLTPEEQRAIGPVSARLIAANGASCAWAWTECPAPTCNPTVPRAPWATVE